MLKKISAFGLLSVVALSCAAIPARADQTSHQVVDQSGAIVGTFNSLDQNDSQNNDQSRRDFGLSGPQDNFQGTRQQAGISGFDNWLNQDSHQDNTQKATSPHVYPIYSSPVPYILYH